MVTIIYIYLRGRARGCDIMTNWIRVKENPGSRMDLPPGKSDVTAMSYLTMQRSELRGYYTSPLEKVKTILCQYVILLCTRIYAPTCVYAPFPNPLNLIEGPALERAARGGPLQLSTRTPSPPSTPPHWIKFVNAPSHQFPLDFLP